MSAHTHFLQDMAAIMLVAGAITLLFHRLRQPVVLGYLLAGIILGPHTPPYPLVTDRDTVQTLGELGVVFLLFSLGLEFSLRKLQKVGVAAAVAALTGIALMLCLGYSLGSAFGWSNMDALFLAAMLAISSTTIIVKALDELGLKQRGFAQLIFGVLIFQDILAIALIALLSGLAVGGGISAGSVAVILSRLGIFLVVALLVGLLLVPRLLNAVASYKSREMLLVSVLGLCFGFCLLVTKLGYSMALGAFVMGAIMAESRQIETIEHLVEPLRDMFCAIFFVTIGMQVDPTTLGQYWFPILAVALVVIVGMTLSITVGALLAGHAPRTALRVGMSLAQVGEFSFIIAGLGLALGVTSSFLYPIIVAVSVLTTLTTPYMIRHSDAVADLFKRIFPRSWHDSLVAYSDWLGSIGPGAEQVQITAIIRRILVHVLLNFCVIAGIFLASAYLVRHGELGKFFRTLTPSWHDTLFWAMSLVLALPFMVAIYRKLEALGLILVEMGAGGPASTRQSLALRQLLARALPVASLLLMLLLISALSATLLPPMHLFIVVLSLVVLLALAVWPAVVRWHSQVQIALRETLEPPRRD